MVWGACLFRLQVKTFLCGVRVWETERESLCVILCVFVWVSQCNQGGVLHEWHWWIGWLSEHNMSKRLQKWRCDVSVRLLRVQSHRNSEKTWLLQAIDPPHDPAVSLLMSHERVMAPQEFIMAHTHVWTQLVVTLVCIPPLACVNVCDCVIVWLCDCVIVWLRVCLTRESSVTESNHGSQKKRNAGSKVIQYGMFWLLLQVSRRIR